MKILIIQLARLGDIYLSWPVTRALKRRYPESQIDFLVRPRFAAALEGLAEINRGIELPTEAIFSPLLEVPFQIDESLKQVDSFIEGLKSENYEMIVNLSFSPASSYITDLISNEKTLIKGYTRHGDGFLSIPDDVSAYFYAQVGVGRPNRVHLSDLFCMMVDIDPINADWKAPKLPTLKVELPERYSVIHIGASDARKSYPAYKWRSVISYLEKSAHLPVILIGSKDEAEDGFLISAGYDPKAVINLVGQTQLYDLFAIIHNADLLMGGDSAPVHIAALVDTPVLNISFSSVNFWETGPRSYRSRVLRLNQEEDLLSEEVARNAMDIIRRKPAPTGSIEFNAGIPGFKVQETEEAAFEWNLVSAIYMNKEFPQLYAPIFADAMKRLGEANAVIREQFETVRQNGDIKRVSGIIDRGEEIIEAIGRMVPPISPLVRWYQTEKVRIGPESSEVILQKTEHVNNLLQNVIDLYVGNEVERESDITQAK